MEVTEVNKLHMVLPITTIGVAVGLEEWEEENDYMTL